MTTRRRFAALIIGSALALTACGPSGNTKDTGGGAKDGGTLTMWTFKQSHVAGLEAAAEEFRKKTGTTVKIELTTPQEAYVSKVQAAARTKSLPDLITVGSADESFKFGAAGVLTDVTDDFDQTTREALLPGLAEAAKLTQLAIDNSKADPQNSLEKLKAGHWYGIPYIAGSSGIVIGRKSMLDAAGVNVAKASGSWEGFVEAVRATHTKSAKKGGLVTGMQVPETGFQWLYRPLSHYYLGKEAFASRDGKAQAPAWTSPESVETFKLVDQMSGLWAPGVFSLGIDQADQAFAQGKAAWDIGGTYTLPFLLQQGMKAEDLVLFPVPAASGGKITKAELAATPILSSGITTQSKNPKGALEFAKFLAAGDGAKAFASAASEMPASAKAARALASDPLLGPVVTALGQNSGNAFNGDDFTALPAGPVQVKHESAVALARLIAGDSTPKQVAKRFADLYGQAWSRVR
ncbi:ABC transporter substrate-binding protein [Streptomyces sp. ISL-100]|uniref:ABC transporter substrate-binding protein n=1 Tax=Streptomyces sp. ISL-100 TaxID=2819173 RepID=UPI001BEC03F3|nr:extracellular solute-binding protein [Streptomyces sp. ISL-100]MBT2395383.1 extracellular solute-binding protein [Streptomyces sp. ISL-100]